MLGMDVFSMGASKKVKRFYVFLYWKQSKLLLIRNR